MRNEEEMMNLILGTARQDERIRAVAMNGSRTNQKAPKDMFQDYDIVYIVKNVDSFIADKSWIDVFGERIIMQTPDDNNMFPGEKRNRYAYLMQFMDGNRIDLTLLPLSEKDDYIKEDKLTIVLMDKDNILPQQPLPTDEDYWIKPPTAEYFAACCNEFWWVSTYVAKGLWRREILYAKKHLDDYVKDMLYKMLEWQVGIETNFQVSAGKCDKYLEKYLSKETWQKLISTFSGGSYEDTWSALFSTCDLFRDTAKNVAEHFRYEYADQDDERVTKYLRHVWALKADAKEVY